MSANERVILVESIQDEVQGYFNAITADCHKMQEKAVKFQNECVELERQVLHIQGRMETIVRLLQERKDGEVNRVNNELDHNHKEDKDAHHHQ